MEKDSRIYVAGHTGMVGSAIVRKLRSEGFGKLILKTHEELDLLDQGAVGKFYERESPEYVVVAAARVGGIFANNTYRAQFIYENLQIQNNLIHHAYLNHVKKLLFLGSSCIYPRDAPQPMKEEFLLLGKLESTNEPYAIAKIAGIKMCESYFHQFGCNFISAMPTNLYGPNDNYDLEASHVIPGLMRRFHEGKVSNASSVEVWGTGKARREFLYVDDCATICVCILETLNADELYSMGVSHINIGCGKDILIADLARLLAEVVKFNGEIKFDASKPDGAPRRLLDISRMNRLGIKSEVPLRDGIEMAYSHFIKTLNQ